MTPFSLSVEWVEISIKFQILPEKLIVMSYKSYNLLLIDPLYLTISVFKYMVTDDALENAFQERAGTL